MINHARSLLLNQQGVGFLDAPGEEYVPAECSQVTLPSFMLNIRRTLFGSSPDDMMLNYRAQQLLPCLHLTELEEFVIALDPRVTYDIGVDDFMSGVFGTIVTQLGGTAQLFLIGTLEEPDSMGRLYRSWLLTGLSSNSIEVALDTPPPSTASHTLSFDSGLSQQVPLHNSGLSFQVAGSVGNQWQIKSYARPQRNIGQLTVALASLGEHVFVELFGVGTPKAYTEPFKTFRNLWYSHPELPYQLGGLLLAYIYRTEELRTGGLTSG